VAKVQRISAETLQENLELYCEPLSKEEEAEIDSEVFELTVEALPQKAGFSYDDLYKKVESVRQDDEWPMPMWVWAASIYGTKAAEVTQRDTVLGDYVFKLNHIFGDKLMDLCKQRDYVYGTWMIAPYFIAGRDHPRLYRLKDRNSTPHEVLEFFGLEVTATDTPSSNRHLTIGTAKIFAHQNTFLNRKTEMPLRETLKTRKNNRSAEVLARSRLELPRGAERPDRAELLQKMTTTLAKHKANSASLVKTHLYNVAQAYKQGGSDPLFILDMDHLLETKGYQRRSDGSFHPDTYRKEWGRLITLSACWIELQPANGRQGKKRDGYIDAPYWQIEARYRLNDGESIGLQPFLLEDPEAPIIKQALIRPGLWWGLSDIGSKRFEIPTAVLALPTDGNGNETERYAVQLAATLAIWVRASQEQHAGKVWGYSVGKLLEASGLKTREEFEDMRTNQVGRLREYLAGEPGDDSPRGAINILTSLGAFDISIRNEADFWASGRKWADRFWEAKLDVQIPNLSIKKSGFKPSKVRGKA
jgi:hypothetical protein